MEFLEKFNQNTAYFINYSPGYDDSISQDYFENREEIAAELTKKPRSKLTSEDIKNKLNYAFVPHIRLISKKQILQLMKINGFEICYVRKRVKSDVNSPAHLEIKAVKKKRTHP